MTQVPLAYLRLCRPDAPLIAFFSYLVGAHLGGGRIGWREVAVAALLALVSTNFIYSLNSLTDEAEDRISHPRRPLPAGEISRADATLYVAGLLLLATAYPLVLASSTFSLALFWLLPALGILYSVPPLRLRRFPVVAVAVISCGLVTPMTIGVVDVGAGRDTAVVLVALLVFCFSVVPLKAVEEVEEAAAIGGINLYARLGRRLFVWTAAGLVVDAALVAALTGGHVRAFLLAMFAGALACLGWFWRRRSVAALYRTMILVVLVVGGAYFAALQLFVLK